MIYLFSTKKCHYLYSDSGLVYIHQYMIDSYTSYEITEHDTIIRYIPKFEYIVPSETEIILEEMYSTGVMNLTDIINKYIMLRIIDNLEL